MANAAANGQESPAQPGRAVRPRSISATLALAIALACSAISAVTLAVLYAGTVREQDAQLERKADEARDYLVGALERPLWDLDQGALVAVASAFAQNELVDRVTVRAPSGAALCAVGKGRDPEARHRTAVIRHRGEAIGTLELAVSTGAARAAVRRLLAAEAATMLVVTLALVALTRLLVRVLLEKPVAALAEVVRPYAEGRYDTTPGELPYLEFRAIGRTLGRMGRTITGQLREVRAAEAQYRSIFENALEGVFRSSPEGRFIDVNPALARMYGYPSPEAMIAEVTDIERSQYVDPADRDRLRRALEADGVLDGFEAEQRRRDGSRFWAVVRARAVRGPDGRVVAYEGMTQDISARRRAEGEARRFAQELERRVAERTAELAAANKELEGFAYSISHDLRAPLRHVDGYVTLLEQSLPAPLAPRSQHFMDAIRAAARRMGRLVDDLLSFSRMGRVGLDCQRVELGQLLAEVVAECGQEAAGRNVRWTIGPLPTVWGDRPMLRVALTNLVSNALKFTRPRSEAVIEVGAAPGGEGEAVLFVRDNGVGFDPAYSDKLFGVFQRLHAAEEFEGIGIGLAYVSRVVTRHGGRAWAEGAVGKGATFYVALPLAAPVSPAARAGRAEVDAPTS